MSNNLNKAWDIVNKLSTDLGYTWVGKILDFFYYATIPYSVITINILWKIQLVIPSPPYKFWFPERSRAYFFGKVPAKKRYNLV